MILRLPIADMTPEARMNLLIWLGVLLVVVIVGFVIILMIRRRLTGQEAAGTEDVGFSLSGLREMRDRGEITNEEYEMTKERVIAKVKSSANAPKKAGPPGRGMSDVDGV